jgi:hypothetical protein
VVFQQTPQPVRAPCALRVYLSESSVLYDVNHTKPVSSRSDLYQTIYYTPRNLDVMLMNFFQSREARVDWTELWCILMASDAGWRPARDKLPRRSCPTTKPAEYITLRTRRRLQRLPQISDSRHDYDEAPHTRSQPPDPDTPLLLQGKPQLSGVFFP